MPLPDLLEPINADQPSGKNLRNLAVSVHDKIEEARRQEDPRDRGDLQRALKEPDYRLVIKLATEALAQTSKDLQVASRLTEALVHREGFSGLTEGLNLLRGLLDKFWDSVYPQPEDDGDLGLRASPLRWVGESRQLDWAVRNLPVTTGGLSWVKYKESRAVGYEADAVDSETKTQKRNEDIAGGKLTAEEFDADAAATPLATLDAMMADAEVALDSLRLLDELCQEKFDDEAPSFRVLRTAIEDVQHVARMLAAPKRDSEPQPEAEPEEEEAESQTQEYADAGVVATGGGGAAAPVRAKVRSVSAEPADREDAIRRIVDAVAYLRKEDARSPVPYLALRGLRWGELRATEGPDAELLEAPSTEIRQQLKRLMSEGQSEQVLDRVESAMGLPCGRGWLDLQRYAVRACDDLGYEYAAVANSIRSELQALLKDFPQLPSMSLLDDTPTANNETLAWIAELTPSEPSAPEPVVETPPPPVEVDDPESLPSNPETPDPYQLALDAARSGDIENAMRILADEISRERSGRGRFLRKMQLAQLCVFSNRHAIAHPILQDLAQEIELRRLESWEQPETLAQMLGLLLQTMQKLGFAADERRKVYAQICRLDPVHAARMAD
jgi:type VI secretion system protein ImpA